MNRITRALRSILREYTHGNRAERTFNALVEAQMNLRLAADFNGQDFHAIDWAAYAQYLEVKNGVSEDSLHEEFRLVRKRKVKAV